MSVLQAITLIKSDDQTDFQYKWRDFVDGGNGYLYGIPHSARRVVQFHMEDKSMKEIGPDLGDSSWKYMRGIKAGNGNIYCPPFNAHYLLKIIPREEKGQDAEVQLLEVEQLNVGYKINWQEGVLANDGCIYYFPCFGDRILKLDPNDDDSLSFVGEKLCSGIVAAVLDGDGYVYVISSTQIIKFNPAENSVSHIGKDLDGSNAFIGAVLADDGNIYAADGRKILKVDTINQCWTIYDNVIHNCRYNTPCWGRPVLGDDKCVYFPHCDHVGILKLNPSTLRTSLIGESFGDKCNKWFGGTLASNGFIYYIAVSTDDVLQIDSRHINEKVIEMIGKMNIH